MHLPPDIITARLRLVAVTPELMRAEIPALHIYLNAEVPAAWPPEHWEPHVFDLLEQQYLKAPATIGWNRYIVLREERPILIGVIGAFVRTEAEAETGYSILPPWQGHGLGSEAARALVTEIFLSPAVQAISAQTFPHLTASVRILEKCGFRPIGPGDDEGTVRYRLEKAELSEMVSEQL